MSFEICIIGALFSLCHCDGQTFSSRIEDDDNDDDGGDEEDVEDEDEDEGPLLTFLRASRRGKYPELYLAKERRAPKLI